MKTILSVILSVVLCCAMLLPQTAVTASAVSASTFRVDFLKGSAKAINTLSNALITAIGKTLNLIIPNTGALNDFSAFDLDSYGDFYEGTKTFLDAPAENAQWSLGYDKESILPADFGTKKYSMGGYNLMATCTETKDGLWVRTIVLNDGSGRGSVAFCVLDAIGIANADVRLIRSALADFAKENNIVSINVSVTHTHSGIDLQGVWHKTIPNVFSNLFLGAHGLRELQKGVDRTFLNTIVAQTKKSVIEAFGSMQPGTLTLAKKDIDDYMRDRTAPYCYDSNLYRLLFTPDDRAARPTILATYGTHPENAGYNQKSDYENFFISADAIPYTDAVLDKAGFNYIFIQGCIGTITYTRGNSNDGFDLTRYEEAVRYGWEIGYILLGMTKTEAECKALNDATGDFLGVNENAGKEGYSVWYANWQSVEEETVKPLLNIAHKQYVIPVTNVLLDIIGKSGITDYFFLYDKASRSYYAVTECGYMELGDSLKVEICPGETYGELLLGGEGLDGFEYPALREAVGEDLIVFDLMNDAIGYIEPDPHYVMAGLAYSAKEDETNPKSPFDTDSWCLISFGEHTASKVVGEFLSLVDSVR